MHHELQRSIQRLGCVLQFTKMRIGKSITVPVTLLEIKILASTQMIAQVAVSVSMSAVKKAINLTMS